MNKHERVRPSFYDEELESESEEGTGGSDNSDDELSRMSFGRLKDALEKIYKDMEDEGTSKRNRIDATGESKRFVSIGEESESESDSDSGPEETMSKRLGKKSKHAPKESSTKRPVSRIRDIQGLPSRFSGTLHEDIRFDPAYGKADLAKVRKNYAFLDEYREKEINQMNSILKNKKSAQILSDRERENLKLEMQSLKSRLDTLNNRDIENEILAKHKQQQMKNFKEGKQSSPYFLKKSEKRKLINKAKFDNMKVSQREKVMERKRKRRLGKEFKELEFRPRL
ncbi:uncharacterized protein PRCAT00000467001 [Priceomyces carsonii]|uniref:uncharacterized protein n=1 Tax=Priceomyces carsonii TaxID=28549 RepID=UPI002ED9D171|nr:unnamed protein product [Priceomyces carsonii]